MLFAALLAPAQSQTLPRLHVQSFVLTASTQSPAIGQAFSVTLTIRVRERLTRWDSVYLPSFSGAEELGDLRSTVVDAHGTTYKETLELQTHSAGDITIGSAYLDAIDARTGKPMRFQSNSLRLSVRGSQTQRMSPAVWYWGAVALLAGAALTALLLLRRRTAPAVQAAPAPPPPLEPARPDEPPADPLHEAFEAVRARRDRASVMRLREVLWQLTGANGGETLADVLRLPAARNERVRGLLFALERAAFIDDERLQRAIDEVLR